MVALSIVAIITTVLLLRHGQFNSSTLLRSLAYSVALSVRQAQSYGTSVRQVTSGATTLFAPSYAVYFTSANQDQYSLAADFNRDNTVATNGNEDVKPPSPYRLRGGYTIKNFCAWTTAGTVHCRAGAINMLAIRFNRPNPDAVILTSQATQTYARACIELSSPSGDTRTVEVTSTGQITISNAGATCT